MSGVEPISPGEGVGGALSAVGGAVSDHLAEVFLIGAGLVAVARVWGLIRWHLSDEGRWSRANVDRRIASEAAQHERNRYRW